MNTLEKIIADKYVEVEARKQQRPVAVLEKSSAFSRTPLSLKSFLLNPTKSGIITEFKRKSPSKGMINGISSVAKVTQGYEQAGASALSVLTDLHYFGGTTEDLELARKQVAIPILRKDFVVDEYQILEAKSMGADCILLIAAALTPEKVQSLAAFAQNLGLEVLLEVHNLEELEQSFCDGLDVVGVNNRNLKNFEVSLDFYHATHKSFQAPPIWSHHVGSDIARQPRHSRHEYSTFGGPSSIFGFRVPH